MYCITKARLVEKEVSYQNIARLWILTRTEEKDDDDDDDDDDCDGWVVVVAGSARSITLQRKKMKKRWEGINQKECGADEK